MTPVPDSNPGDATVIAVVGCGAISEAFHLPALRHHLSDPDQIVLVDRNPHRLDAMGEQFGLRRRATDLTQVLGEVHGAVVAAPPQHHVAIATTCMEAGVHVLCEKPLAQTTEEAEALVALAAERSVHLGVNLVRRLQSSSRLVHELVQSGAIGEPLSLEYVQGEGFDWPAAENSYFGAAVGRGVLADIGSHVLDLASWWLGGSLRLESYQDDSRGGTEAVARVEVSSGRCRGRVLLSWLTRYRNDYRIQGTEGMVEGQLYDERTVVIRDANGHERERRSGPPVDVAKAMLGGFISAIRGESEVPVPGREVLPSIRVIEECYANRELLPAPWYENAAPLEAR